MNSLLSPQQPWGLLTSISPRSLRKSKYQKEFGFGPSNRNALVLRGHVHASMNRQLFYLIYISLKRKSPKFIHLIASHRQLEDAS